MAIEKWTALVEYPTYEISIFGEVRTKEAKMFKGTEIVLIPPRKLKPYDVGGTVKVMLYKLHERYEIRLNLLVMKAFGDAHRKMNLLHINGNYFDCAFNNLKFK
jgi:hypothetical protein